MPRESMSASEKAAVAAAKVAARAIRLLGAGLGSNLPGRIARKVAPAVLTSLSSQARRGVIAVTGTNGKSTTSGLLSSVLRTAGWNLVHNRQGANLVTGITASLIDASTWDGSIDADYCLFEIDEAALPVIAREVKIGTILVTNLFRDQLDRFGELDTTAKLISKGITINGSQSVLNADDPNVSQLAPDCKHFYFGIETLSASESDGANGACESAEGMIPPPQVTELAYCGACEAEIAYEKVFYGQLGHWRCTKCDYKRPAPQMVARQVEVTATGSRFNLHLEGTPLVVDIKLSLPGLFNVYNALAAAAAASTLGVTLESIKQGLQRYTTLFGRSEKISVHGKPVLIQLIKNPAGATQAVAAAAQDSDARILIAINDNLADGRDISWLWDADFEQLAAHGNKNEIVVSGQRAEDMAVRMKYAGVDQSKITCIPKLDKALSYSLENTRIEQTLWILPTYTCLLELQRVMKSLGHALAET